MHPDGVSLHSDSHSVRAQTLSGPRARPETWPIRATPRRKYSKVIAAWARIRSARYLLWTYPMGAGEFRSGRMLSGMRPGAEPSALIEERKRSDGLCFAWCANATRFTKIYRLSWKKDSSWLKLTGKALWAIWFGTLECRGHRMAVLDRLLRK